MYTLLNKSTDITTGKIFWNRKYKLKKDEWGKIFSEPFKNTKDSTVQRFNRCPLSYFQSRFNLKIFSNKHFIVPN